MTGSGHASTFLRAVVHTLRERLLAEDRARRLVAVAVRVADGGGQGWRSPWAPVALFHQDLALVALVALVHIMLARAGSTEPRRARRTALILAYAALAGYTALNVAVARVLSTPLTYPLLAAAGGALADSIAGYVTLPNLAAIGAVLTVAWAAPRWRSAGGVRAALSSLGIAALVSLPLGRFATARVETLGLHRNAVIALVSSSLARFSLLRPARSSSQATRLAEEGDAIGLGHFRGSAARKHVIWVVLESTAAQYLSFYGAASDPTPRLTALAENALVFEHAFAAYPESIKGLFSVLCSAYPAPSTPAARYAEPRRPCTTLASVLRARGYATATFHSGRFVYLGMSGIIEGRGFDELRDAGSMHGAETSSFGTDDASTVKRLLEFVAERSKQGPVFAMYLPISGHHPYRSPGSGPRPFAERADHDRYLNDLYAGDDALGALLDGIRRLGLFHDTLFVVHGDSRTRCTCSTRTSTSR